MFKFIRIIFFYLISVLLGFSGQLSGSISESAMKETEQDLIQYLNARSHVLIDSDSLDTLITEAGERRLILLGESTHGTSEFYIWRSRISKRLIEDEGFDFVLVEGDWPSFYQINRYVKELDHQESSAEDLLRENFNRWPEWMWSNSEVADFVEWLRDYNSDRLPEERVGIYGMDVYSKEESITEVRSYLNGLQDPEFAEVANLYDCFTPYRYDGGNYARAIYRGAEDCSSETRGVVDFLLENREFLSEQCLDAYFNAKQNAVVVKNAEKHYRHAIGWSPESWNYRVYHMEETVYRLLDYYGEESKGIVWAHNTHVGDARATPMSGQGRYNIGQLLRVNLGRENVFSIGLGSYTGQVLAGSEWGSRMRRMEIPEAAESSLEYLLNRVDKTDFFLIFDEEMKEHHILNEERGHRAIGVVYDPRNEFPGNYVPTIITSRYDAFIFIKETEPLNYLH